MKSLLSPNQQARRLGRQIIAAALASALAEPLHPLARRSETFDPDVIRVAWDQLIIATRPFDKNNLSLGERLPADVDIAPMLEWLDKSPADRRQPYQQAFGLLVSRLCPPYATEYCPSKDPHRRASQMADMAGFYRAFGLQVSAAAPERPDHLAAALEFISLLHEKRLSAGEHGEHADVCEQALRAFVKDHIAWWVPTFARCLTLRVQEVCGHQVSQDVAPLDGIAQVLAAWSTTERLLGSLPKADRLGLPVVEPEPEPDTCGSNCSNECDK